MPYERTGYAPWSLTREAGVESATVDGTIQVPQYGQPIIDIGFVDEKGVWQGRKSNDRDFIGITKAEGIANGGDVLFPDTNNFPSIDMTGFEDIFIALLPTNGGNYQISAVMGPDTQSFANLSPVNSATNVQYKSNPDTASDGRYNFVDVFSDTQQAMTADVWNIFMIQSRARNWKNLQFKFVNDSGGASDMTFGFMRMV
jgi:hypothetical protein